MRIPSCASACARRSLCNPIFQVVGEASTGELALKLALELKPDVMVMELSLPGMSGLEAIRQI